MRGLGIWCVRRRGMRIRRRLRWWEFLGRRETTNDSPVVRRRWLLRAGIAVVRCRQRRPSAALRVNRRYVWSAARSFLSQFEAQTSEIIGSNNFVVSGEHTASGKPILANDTHLEFSMPGIWYIVHLTAPGWNVAGFTFPGSPLVVIGHNDRIAWGFTNSNAEVEDLYVESFNPANPLEYRVNGNWVRAETRREVIHVRGAADDLLDVVLTRHGPVVRRDSTEEGGRVYSLRWTALEPGALDFSYPLIGGAQDWDEFLLVMSKVAGPGQNAVYADVNGNIGYVMAARIPIRRTGNGRFACGWGYG